MCGRSDDRPRAGRQGIELHTRLPETDPGPEMPYPLRECAEVCPVMLPQQLFWYACADDEKKLFSRTDRLHRMLLLRPSARVTSL